jgi:hypothetical protein
MRACCFDQGTTGTVTLPARFAKATAGNLTKL